MTYRTNSNDISQRRACRSPFAIVGWVVLVSAGMTWLVDYSSAPGIAGNACDVWPSKSAISRGKGPTLVVFLHPRCPCSRATVSELARLLASCRRSVDVRFAMFCPVHEKRTWAHTKLWNAAATLSDVPPLIDREGREASRFGVAISGHVLLFSPKGERLYGGGITSSRGHEGSNLGSDAIRMLLKGEPVKRAEYPVYGCMLKSNRE